MSRYFKKHAINHHFNANGKRVDFEHVGNQEGVRKLDETLEGPLVAELDRAADQRRGGIVRISEEVYDGLKKNLKLSPPSPSRPVGLAPIRVHNPESLLPKSNAPVQAAVTAGAAMPTPKVVVTAPVPVSGTTELPKTPKPPFKPNTGRRSDVDKKVADAKA